MTPALKTFSRNYKDRKSQMPTTCSKSLPGLKAGQGRAGRAVRPGTDLHGNLAVPAEISPQDTRCHLHGTGSDLSQPARESVVGTLRPVPVTLPWASKFVEELICPQ